MRKYIDSHFEDSIIELDGGDFDRCKFVRCTLNYRGGTLPKISNTAITECSYNLLDGARRTLDFLRGLYAAGGTKSVREYIAFITASEPVSGENAVQ